MSKFLKTFVDAVHGIKDGITQRNMRIHIVIAAVVFAAGFYLELSKMEWFTVIILTGMVWSAELFNTAIENEANIMRDELGAPYSIMGRAKDLAAGAVLVLAIAAAIIGITIFLPKISNIFL
jgi:diacylglycerol kinase (ATP)